MTTARPDIASNEASINATLDVLNAVVFAITRQLSLEQQNDLASDLSRLAKDAEQKGNAVLDGLLQELHRTARAAGGAARE